MPTADLSRFCCLNPECQLHQRRNGGNLLVVDRFGEAQHRQFYCRACKDRSSAFKGRPLYRSRLPHETVLAILEHLAEGRRVRQTARLVGVNKDTVTAWPCSPVGTPRPPTTSWRLLPPQTREVQLDEKWDLVAKKQHHS